ncbi:serine protease inhibitor 88Ea-like [Anopheles marshallii]|uniref:serine protease inhibitor 88Ea-like n=1 Tax=Anopheles marshallii TaxID=1521116 RepID=UPI00237B104C|nr:serine protease inhibitor 88Ea-like [Anopheles marshallii]
MPNLVGKGARVLLLLLGLITILTLPSAYGQCSPGDEKKATEKSDLDQSRTRLYKGESIFTLQLLDAINTATPNENLFFSPYSLYNVLLMMYFGAQNSTEKLLRTGLNLQWSDSKTTVHEAYDTARKSLQGRFSESNAVGFSSVDKLFFGRQIPISTCMQQKFADTIEQLDYENKPEEQRVYINRWVEMATRGHIKDLLVPGAISRNTKLAIANAAYFKGTWQTKFKAAETKKEIFYISADRQLFVDMMHVEGTFSHAANEKLGCHILELPYSAGGEGDDNEHSDNPNQVSMFVFLPPAEPNALSKLLARLAADTNILHEVVNDGISRKVDVKLPKFNIEKTVEMKPVLERLGMGELFENTANFDSFTDGREPIGFDEVLQKSKIEVNEEGSVAASATIAFSFRSSRPVDPAMFHCNHPFVFIIYDYGTRSVLFNGVYRQPE